MIDNGVVPKMPSSDPVAYAGAGAKAEKPGDKGFSHTLENVSHKDQKSSGHKSNDKGSEDVPLDLEAEVSATPNKTKPTIDIRFTLTQGRTKSADAEHDEAAENAGKAASQLAAAGKGRKGAHAAIADKAEKSSEADPGSVALDAEAVAKEVSLGQMLSMLKAEDGQAGTEMADTVQDVRATKPLKASDSAAAVADALDFGLKSQVGTDAGDMGGMGEGSQEGKAFRLVRADGKGAPLSVKSDENSLQATSDARSASKDIEPTVTVLDARRFIAPISMSNASNISAAVLGDSSWVDAMRAAGDVSGLDPSQSAAGKVVNTLKIQMNPIELGLVTANLRLVGETLSVHLTVESHAALRKLNEDQNDIVKALQSQGFAVDNVQVSVAARSEQGAGNQQGQQQTQGQGFAQNGGQGGLQGEQRQGGGNGDTGFSNAMGTNGNEETAPAATSRGASGAGRTGDLYL